MLQLNSVCSVCDNSGVLTVKCIKVLGRSYLGYGYVGNIIVCVVKTAKKRRKLKPGDIKKAVIVRSKTPLIRYNGIRIHFDSSSVALLNANESIVGTRIKGPVPRELRKFNWVKLLTMARYIV